MLMTAIEALKSAAAASIAYPEIAGKRILITGVSSRFGVDIARSFAEHRARLVLQFDEASEAMQALAELIAPTALELSIHAARPAAEADIVQFARAVAQQYGGLDAVINIVHLDPAGACVGVDCAGDVAAVEARVCELLLLPCLVARVAANRMRLTHTEGVIINIAVLAAGAGAPERAFAAVAKSTLTAMTRSEAQAWAEQAIRFNAIAPEVGGGDSSGLAGETDMAALALFLASGRGKSLSGHVFEADAA